MELNAKYGYSFASGAFAAAGSFFGKMPSFLSPLVLSKLDFLMMNMLPLIMMLICNLMNLRYFLKALQKSEQTLTAITLTAATNYILTFILGILIYNESFTLLSTFGVLLITAGIWFLCSAQNAKEKKS